MPLLRLPEERLDPHLPLAHRLLEGVRLSGRLGPLDRVDEEGAMDDTALRALRTRALQRTGIAGGRVRPIDGGPLGEFVALPAQGVVRRAAVLVVRGVVAEVAGAEEGCPVLIAADGQIGADAGILQ